MSVVIETTIGDITVDLFIEERPVACLNFLKLCRLKYYNFNLFHTVEQGFIAQTGDPTGAGDGGSSVWGVVEGLNKRFFEAESLPKIKHSSPGLLSLVSVGKNMVGSQFFFTLGSDLTSLDGIHCVIGEVVEGHEILRKLNESIVDEKFRPFQDIRVTHTVVLDDPFPNPRGFRVPSRSPSPSAERLQNGRIGADEDIDDTSGKTAEEIQEMLAEREAKARATILEIVGDLPDADMAPPENVLFVCKLNPVTTDDDLEIIFSRFGKVKSCEVIRDKKTGDSLQYAFIEFEEQKSCELAYFKMDNVLIDDRRIHVDFSQSVAKVKWRGKGRGIEGQYGKLDFNNLKDDGGKNVTKKRQNDESYKRMDRNRISSDERRKAREERHRYREHEERSRSNKYNYDRSRDDDDRRRRRNTRENSRERRRETREKSKERENRLNRRSSPKRRRNANDADDFRRHEIKAESNMRNAENKYQEKSYEKRKESDIKEKHKLKKQIKKKNKRKTQSSTDEDSSSESSNTDSTTSTDSDDKRKARKKSSKKKKKSSKKSKKYKR